MKRNIEEQDNHLKHYKSKFDPELAAVLILTFIMALGIFLALIKLIIS